MLDQLITLLRENADLDSNPWLDDFLDQQPGNFNQRQFYYAFSGATRRFPKIPLKAPGFETREDGFSVQNWTVDQLARSVMLQFLAQQDHVTFSTSLAALADTADIRESVAIFSTFPLLPYPEELVPLAREGLRTNIVDVFDAIALGNPFPAQHFDEEGWNQMILKAFFLARPIDKIIGLETRANAELVVALSNYAHERWAAGRPVSPELWHSCQGFITETVAADLLRVACTEAPGQREAAALVAASTDEESLREVREKVADLLPKVKSGELTWETLGAQLHEN